MYFVANIRAQFPPEISFFGYAFYLLEGKLFWDVHEHPAGAVETALHFGCMFDETFVGHAENMSQPDEAPFAYCCDYVEGARSCACLFMGGLSCEPAQTPGVASVY